MVAKGTMLAFADYLFDNLSFPIGGPLLSVIPPVWR